MWQHEVRAIWQVHVIAPILSRQLQVEVIGRVEVEVLREDFRGFTLVGQPVEGEEELLLAL